MRNYFFRIFRRPTLPIPAPKIFSTPSQALRTVTSRDRHGIYASSDHLFKGAVFGRDSLEVAEDLMMQRPELVEDIILTLARLQGEVTDERNEEEPGKIIHEYRRVIVDGKKIDQESLKIFHKLAKRWGGDAQQLAYYGSVDATPHFIRTLGKYTDIYGDEILTQQVTLRSGHSQSVITVVENALDWLENNLDSAKSGLVEFRRLNKDGIANQAWKDSNEFYVHENGELANHDRPIASIEVQALAYDALKAAARIFPSRSKHLVHRADSLRRKTINKLWAPKINYFALGIDYDQKGHERIIETVTANPAALLDSQFFDTHDEKQRYISEIAREIMGTEFLTDVGIRSRALSEAHLISFWDYHGSYTSWPKETFDIAKGLRRWGLPMVAEELENRLLNVVRAVSSYPEFFYVDARGRILGMPKSSKSHGELVLRIDSINQPERVQAWTVSTIMAINASRRPTLARKQQTAQTTWQKELEDEILRAIPHVPRLKSAKELAARYPAYQYQLKDKE